MFTDRKLSHSETRIRHCRPVSRVGDVSDTDTPGIRPGYVSAACPRIPGYVGRKLTNGDVLAQSIRPSPTFHRSFLSLVTYSRVPTPPTRHSPPHAAASASDSPTRRPDPPPAGDQPPPSPATSLRPRRRRGAPATATKGCTRPPATSPRVPRRRRRAAPGRLQRQRSPATASP